MLVLEPCQESHEPLPQTIFPVHALVDPLSPRYFESLFIHQVVLFTCQGVVMLLLRLSVDFDEKSILDAIADNQMCLSLHKEDIQCGPKSSLR